MQMLHEPTILLCHRKIGGVKYLSTCDYGWGMDISSIDGCLEFGLWIGGTIYMAAANSNLHYEFPWTHSELEYE